MGKIKKKTRDKSSKSTIKRAKNGNSIATILLFLAVLVTIAIFSQLDKPTNESLLKKIEVSAKNSIAKVHNEAVEVVKKAQPEKDDKKTPKKSVVNKVGVKKVAINEKILHLPSIADSTYYVYNNIGRYSMLFSPRDKVAHWVAYILTKTEVRTIGVERSHTFKVDNNLLNIGASCATNSDYRKSGYDRGHLLPSADRNDNRKENDATFLFGNIAPQRPNLNRKTINLLEQATRNWALKYDTLYVVTGSILNDSRPHKTIGKRVTVPYYFYKGILAKVGGNYESVAFLLPNSNDANSDFVSYITSVDAIEKKAGVDLFHHLPDVIENRVEKSYKATLWR